VTVTGAQSTGNRPCRHGRLAQAAAVVNHRAPECPFIRIHETKHASGQRCDGTVLSFEFLIELEPRFCAVAERPLACEPRACRAAARGRNTA